MYNSLADTNTAAQGFDPKEIDQFLKEAQKLIDYANNLAKNINAGKDSPSTAKPKAAGVLSGNSKTIGMVVLGGLTVWALKDVLSSALDQDKPRKKK